MSIVSLHACRASNLLINQNKLHTCLRGAGLLLDDAGILIRSFLKQATTHAK